MVMVRDDLGHSRRPLYQTQIYQMQMPRGCTTLQRPNGAHLIVSPAAVGYD